MPPENNGTGRPASHLSRRKEKCDHIEYRVAGPIMETGMRNTLNGTVMVSEQVGFYFYCVHCLQIEQMRFR